MEGKPPRPWWKYRSDLVKKASCLVTPNCGRRADRFLYQIDALLRTVHPALRHFLSSAQVVVRILTDAALCALKAGEIIKPRGAY